MPFFGMSSKNLVFTLAMSGVTGSIFIKFAYTYNVYKILTFNISKSE